MSEHMKKKYKIVRKHQFKFSDFRTEWGSYLYQTWIMQIPTKAFSGSAYILSSVLLSICIRLKLCFFRALWHSFTRFCTRCKENRSRPIPGHWHPMPGKMNQSCRSSLHSYSKSFRIQLSDYSIKTIVTFYTFTWYILTNGRRDCHYSTGGRN